MGEFLEGIKIWVNSVSGIFIEIWKEIRKKMLRSFHPFTVDLPFLMKPNIINLNNVMLDTNAYDELMVIIKEHIKLGILRVTVGDVTLGRVIALKDDIIRIQLLGYIGDKGIDGLIDMIRDYPEDFTISLKYYTKRITKKNNINIVNSIAMLEGCNIILMSNSVYKT